MSNSQIVKTYKVKKTTQGVLLVLNGAEFELGPSAHSIVFEIKKALSETSLSNKG